MKIVIVGPVYPYRGGIAHYTARLAQELSRQHQVSVLSFHRQYPSWLYPGKSDRDPSQKPVSVPAEYLLEPLNPASWLRSARWIQGQKPDLVIIQWWVTFWSPAYTFLASRCRQAGVPVIFMIHNVVPHEGGPIHRPLARLALKQGTGFIVHTTQEQQRLQSLVPGASAEVCPFPVYDMLASPATLTKEESRQQLELPQGARVLLFFGIVRPYKGLQVLLEALGELRARRQVIHLLVAGEFWEDKTVYQALMEKLQITDQVRLEDRYIPNEELPIFFSAADAAVAPYTGGTQSAVVGLALGFGIPLLITDRSAAGVDPAVKDQVVTVPPGNALALADAIQSLFHNLSRTPVGARPTPGDGWANLAAAIEKIRSRSSR